MAKNKTFFSKVRDIRTNLFKHWKQSVLLLIALLVIFFVYKKLTAQPVGITSMKVAKTTLTTDFSANGKIKAKKAADLKFYSPGKVTWVGVKNGDTIRAWQGVASLDTVSLNSAYQQALNNLRNYQALADSVLDSVQGHSIDENFATRATRTTAEVNRDNSYDAVLAAQDNLKNAVLVSPIAGTVVDTNDILPGINLTGADLESK